tara:strand:+ start:6054 stop:7151 length:1098 start_codon:yes stop_codon:yes gene_type:complete
MNRLEDYAYKCALLRKIMSNKAYFFRKVNAIQNLATVVVSSFLLFIGFSGTKTIHENLSKIIEIELTSVEFGFNLFVFFIFLLAILHLVFHFGKKQSDAERAIVFLTNLINQIEDMLSSEQRGKLIISNLEVEMIRHKYESVVQSIPANTDKEFIKAKKDYKIQERKKNKLSLTGQEVFIDSENERVFLALIKQSSLIMDILKILRDVDSGLYLGGGVVRNSVWDFLHGYPRSTPVDDVDVVYFNKLNSSKVHDTKLESILESHASNLKWSVKNQARMNIFNNECEYFTMEDAVSKWPETATSIVIRLDESGRIIIIKPHGLSDLFRLIVRPTPHFSDKKQRIVDRMTTRKWLSIWPKLKTASLE